MHLLMAQFGYGDGGRKKIKTGEGGIYQMAQVGSGDGRRKKSKTEEERRAKNGFDLIWI